jgi:hypothetical protein
LVLIKNSINIHIFVFNRLCGGHISNHGRCYWEQKLEDAIDELKEQTASPMNTMLNKQSREEAIQKRNTRDRMQLVDVPPTNPGILKLVIIQLDLKSVNNAMTVDHPKFVTFYYFSSY